MRPAEIKRQAAQDYYDSEHAQSERNIKGQFATPYKLALSIMRDAVQRFEKPPQTMLEPACGTGAFISAAKELAPGLQIVGIEKDPTVCKEAAELWTSDTTQVMNLDFFDAVQDCQPIDLLVTNPPYTRHHHLTPQDKNFYGRVVEGLTGTRLSQLAGLHAYFVLSGTALLRPGGIASWLIPAELFSVNYGKPIRSYVTSEVTAERLHFFNNNDLQFSDALVSSCVLVLRRKVAKGTDPVLITSGSFDEPSCSEYISIEELSGMDKWQHFFTKRRDKATSNIGDFFTIKRGLSTGAESFYARNRSEWNSMGIDDRWLIPVLPAPRYMRERVVESDGEGWPIKCDRALLNIPCTYDESELPKSISAYLESCPEKIRASYTAQHRKKWYSIEQRKPAPIVCTYMSRSDSQPFRFIRNKSQAVVTTAYLCLYPRNDLTETQLDKICEELNSIDPSALINSGREYGGGLRKLEPKELQNVPFAPKQNLDK